MSTKQVMKAPQCSFCPQPAKYDAPTKTGQWAYLCSDCANLASTPSRIKVGTEFVVVEPSKKQGTKKVMLGKEPNNIDYWEGVTVNGESRVITCPVCGMQRNMEPDSSGDVFECENCKQRVKVPEGLC